MIFTYLAPTVQPKRSTVHRLSNGYSVLVNVGPGQGATEDFDDSVDIFRGTKKIAYLNLRRNLIGPWIADDKFWGSAKAAKEIRYSDNPHGEAGGMVQGLVSEIVPKPGGLYLRLGLIGLGPSIPSIGSDYVLKWEESEPARWSVVASSGAGYSPYSKTVRLPESGSTRYFVSNTGLINLANGKLVAKFPGRHHWFLVKQVGSRFTLGTMNWPGQKPIPTLVVDVARTPPRTRVLSSQ